MSVHDQIPEFLQGLPEIDLPLPGVTGWLMQGATMQTVFVKFDETVEVPDHSHEDQWEIPVAGRVELRREGRTEEHGPGEPFFVPAGQEHGATVHAGYRAVIMFDARDRYLPK